MIFLLFHSDSYLPEKPVITEIYRRIRYSAPRPKASVFQGIPGAFIVFMSKGKTLYFNPTLWYIG